MMAPIGTKSVYKAYFLWCISGYLGGHHFYLGRDVHAFLWLTTLGGFHIGLLRDVWRIPHYVRQTSSIEGPYPTHASSFSLPLLLGQVSIGIWYSFLFYNFPSPHEATRMKELGFIGNDDDNKLYQLSGLIGLALGIYLPGQASNVQSSFRLIFAGVFLGYYFPTIVTGVPPLTGLPLVLGILFFYIGKKNKLKHERKKRNQSVIWRWLKLCFFVSLFWMAVLRSMFYHVTIQVQDPVTGIMKPTKLRDILLFDAHLWEEILRLRPFQQFWNTPWYDDQDMEERNAYRELEMNGCIIGKKECDSKHVKQKFYQLSKLYHPDKMMVHNNNHNNDKQQTNEKMSRLNHAYELLIQRLKER